MDLKKRNQRIIEALNKFTEEMLREPGAKERCRAYLKKIGEECGYHYDEEGNIHYDYD